MEHVLAADDAGTVEALRARDEATFEGLVRQSSGSLLRVAQIYVLSAAVAEEVVQETWIAVGPQAPCRALTPR